MEQWNSSPITFTVVLLVVLYVAWLVGVKLAKELRLIFWYRKLPGPGYIGIAGWILGNADVYYYYLSHLDRKKGNA